MIPCRALQRGRGGQGRAAGGAARRPPKRSRPGGSSDEGEDSEGTESGGDGPAERAAPKGHRARRQAPAAQRRGAGAKQDRAARARAEAHARAEQAEQATEQHGRPLLAHPLEHAAWDGPLPVAPYAPRLPARPEGPGRGAYHYGWVTPEMEAQLAERAWRDALRCGACGTGEAAGDALVECVECDAVRHLRCLVPPLKNAPKAGWTCAECKPAQARRRKEERQRQKAQARADAQPTVSAYEQQRLDNMASNQRVLEGMGLA